MIGRWCGRSRFIRPGPPVRKRRPRDRPPLTAGTTGSIIVPTQHIGGWAPKIKPDLLRPASARDALQRCQVLAGRRSTVFLDCPVTNDYRLPQFRQARAAAAAPSRRGLHHRGAQRSVEILDQLPRAPVRDMQRSARCRDRTRPGDFLQYRNLARADPCAGRKVHPDAQATCRFVRSGGTRSRRLCL